MKTSTQSRYAKRINEVNCERSKRGLPALQTVWCSWPPSCKMRVLGGDDLKGFTRRFVIIQLNTEECYEKHRS